jgi:hypothetical protein
MFNLMLFYFVNDYMHILKSTSAFIVSITKYGAEIAESITISLLFSFNLK